VLSLEQFRSEIARLARLRDWTNLRRIRQFESPLPFYLYDNDFLNWMTTVSDDAVARWADLYGQPPDTSGDVDTLRLHLAMLRPMPLELLRVYSEHRVTARDVLAGCSTPPAATREYIVQVVAYHVVLRLAELQQSALEGRRDPFGHGEQYFGRRHRVVSADDLQLLPESLEMRARGLNTTLCGEAATAVPPRRLPQLASSSTCAVCSQSPAMKPEERFSSRPPYRLGCTCRVENDPDFDWYVEAGVEQDLANGGTPAGPAYSARRLVLHLLEQRANTEWPAAAPT
jgi:hypothetical protein